MDRNASPDERLLLERVAAGDEKAFAVVVERYWKNIYGQALTYVKSTHQAQDIVQEVFIKIWEKRQSLDRIERFDSFLFIVARNHIISELRKKIALPLERDMLEMVREEGALPDKQLSLKQLQQHLAMAITHLPPQQKVAYLLSRDENLSFEAIAQRMGLSRETIKKHICRALNSIRTYIRTHSDITGSIVFITMLYEKAFK